MEQDVRLYRTPSNLQNIVRPCHAVTDLTEKASGKETGMGQIFTLINYSEAQCVHTVMHVTNESVGKSCTMLVLKCDDI